MPALVDAGAAAFKLSTFETHPERFPRIPDGQLLAAFAAIAAAGGLAGVHAENDEIVRAGIAAEQAAGHGGDPLAHARSRPPVAEHEAIARVLELARATGVRLHVCHVSTPRGVELVAAARRDGVDVSAETCPHYLLLDESELVRRGGEAKINPPLRAAPLPADGLDLISSDHVGWPVERKHGPDIFALASGAPGRRADRRPGPRRARRRRAGAPGQRGPGPALRAVAAQGQPAPGRRRRRARARPRRRSGRSTRLRWSPPPAGARTAGRRVRGRVIAAFSRGRAGVGRRGRRRHGRAPATAASCPRRRRAGIARLRDSAGAAGG